MISNQKCVFFCSDNKQTVLCFDFFDSKRSWEGTSFTETFLVIAEKW